MKLVTYLAQLNTSENQWSLWVNPENVDDYRVGQDCFENGGILDDFIRVGSLESVSFGFQSNSEAFANFISTGSCDSIADRDYDVLYKGELLEVNLEELWEAYNNGDLAEDFEQWIDDGVDDIVSIWAEEEAWSFVYDRIPEIIAEAQAYEEVYA